MTLVECTAILAPLATMLHADMDAPMFRAYFRALEDVPTHLLAAAVERAAKSARFMPKPGELRQYAEDARKALIAAHPYDGCCECDGHKGWRPVLVDGVQRVERCPCWGRHQEKLARLGVGSTPLALPAAVEAE